jgi:hypothetical protein
MDASLFGRGAGEGLGVHICTGPVAIKGAELGDILEVRILDVKPRPSGNSKFPGKSSEATRPPGGDFTTKISSKSPSHAKSSPSTRSIRRARPTFCASLGVTATRRSARPKVRSACRGSHKLLFGERRPDAFRRANGNGTHFALSWSHEEVVAWKRACLTAGSDVVCMRRQRVHYRQRRRQRRHQQQRI